MVHLIDKAELRIPRPSARFFRQHRDIAPLPMNGACIRRIEAAKEVHESALARAAGTGNRHARPRIHAKRNIREHRDFITALKEALA